MASGQRLREIRALRGGGDDRTYALIALAKHATRRRDVRQLLRIGGETESDDLRCDIASALGSMGPPSDSTLGEMRNWYTNSRSKSVRAAVLAALIETGPTGCAATADLLQLRQSLSEREQLIRLLEALAAGSSGRDEIARLVLARLGRSRR